MFAQWQNGLTMYFSEHIFIIKWAVAVYVYVIYYICILNVFIDTYSIYICMCVFLCVSVYICMHNYFPHQLNSKCHWGREFVLLLAIPPAARKVPCVLLNKFVESIKERINEWMNLSKAEQALKWITAWLQIFVVIVLQPGRQDELLLAVCVSASVLIKYW